MRFIFDMINGAQTPIRPIQGVDEVNTSANTEEIKNEVLTEKPVISYDLALSTIPLDRLFIAPTRLEWEQYSRFHSRYGEYTYYINGMPSYYNPTVGGLSLINKERLDSIRQDPEIDLGRLVIHYKYPYYGFISIRDFLVDNPEYSWQSLLREFYSFLRFNNEIYLCNYDVLGIPKLAIDRNRRKGISVYEIDPELNLGIFEINGEVRIQSIAIDSHMYSRLEFSRMTRGVTSGLPRFARNDTDLDYLLQRFERIKQEAGNADAELLTEIENTESFIQRNFNGKQTPSETAINRLRADIEYLEFEMQNLQVMEGNNISSRLAEIVNSEQTRLFFQLSNEQLNLILKEIIIERIEDIIGRRMPELRNQLRSEVLDEIVRSSLIDIRRGNDFVRAIDTSLLRVQEHERLRFNDEIRNRIRREIRETRTRFRERLLERARAR